MIYRANEKIKAFSSYMMLAKAISNRIWLCCSSRCLSCQINTKRLDCFEIRQQLNINHVDTMVIVIENNNYDK